MKAKDAELIEAATHTNKSGTCEVFEGFGGSLGFGGLGRRGGILRFGRGPWGLRRLRVQGSGLGSQGLGTWGSEASATKAYELHAQASRCGLLLEAFWFSGSRVLAAAGCTAAGGAAGSLYWIL